VITTAGAEPYYAPREHRCLRKASLMIKNVGKLVMRVGLSSTIFAAAVIVGCAIVLSSFWVMTFARISVAQLFADRVVGVVGVLAEVVGSPGYVAANAARYLGHSAIDLIKSAEAWIATSIETWWYGERPWYEEALFTFAERRLLVIAVISMLAFALLGALVRLGLRIVKNMRRRKDAQEAIDGILTDEEDWVVVRATYWTKAKSAGEDEPKVEPVELDPEEVAIGLHGDDWEMRETRVLRKCSYQTKVAYLVAAVRVEHPVLLQPSIANRQMLARKINMWFLKPHFSGLSARFKARLIIDVLPLCFKATRDDLDASRVDADEVSSDKSSKVRTRYGASD